MLKSEDKARAAFDDSTDTGDGGSEQRSRPQVADNLGFVGLGRMGMAMAANLVTSGRQVIAYVRRAERISELRALSYAGDWVTRSIRRRGEPAFR
jgi:phosphoglycerate dehydrogenase-like enzyme